MPRQAARARCSFKDGKRRCPFDGTGKPPLCDAHRIAIAEAAKPRSPATLLSEFYNNFMSGKPINVEATLGAVQEVFGQWQGMAAGYHPDVRGGEREGAAHARAGRGQQDASWWTPRPGQGSAPRQPGVDQQVLEARRRARQIMGFAEGEPLTPEVVKKRHRQLVGRWHPDRPGGSHKKMAAINDAADVLFASL